MPSITVPDLAFRVLMAETDEDIQKACELEVLQHFGGLNKYTQFVRTPSADGIAAIANIYLEYKTTLRSRLIAIQQQQQHTQQPNTCYTLDILLSADQFAMNLAPFLTFNSIHSLNLTYLRACWIARQYVQNYRQNNHKTETDKYLSLEQYFQYNTADKSFMKQIIFLQMNSGKTPLNEHTNNAAFSRHSPLFIKQIIIPFLLKQMENKNYTKWISLLQIIINQDIHCKYIFKNHPGCFAILWRIDFTKATLTSNNRGGYIKLLNEIKSKHSLSKLKKMIQSILDENDFTQLINIFSANVNKCIKNGTTPFQLRKLLHSGIFKLLLLNFQFIPSELKIEFLKTLYQFSQSNQFTEQSKPFEKIAFLQYFPLIYKFIIKIVNDDQFILDTLTMFNTMAYSIEYTYAFEMVPMLEYLIQTIITNQNTIFSDSLTKIVGTLSPKMPLSAIKKMCQFVFNQIQSSHNEPTLVNATKMLYHILNANEQNLEALDVAFEAMSVCCQQRNGSFSVDVFSGFLDILKAFDMKNILNKNNTDHCATIISFAFKKEHFKLGLKINKVLKYFFEHNKEVLRQIIETIDLLNIYRTYFVHSLITKDDHLQFCAISMNIIAMCLESSHEPLSQYTAGKIPDLLPEINKLMRVDVLKSVCIKIKSFSK